MTKNEESPDKTLLTVTNVGSTYHTFSHAALAYLMLKYSCGIHDIKYESKSEEGAGMGFLTVSSDGMLIFKAMVNRDWDMWSTLFLVMFFDGKQYPVQPPLNLGQVKKLFITSLQKEIHEPQLVSSEG